MKNCFRRAILYIYRLEKCPPRINAGGSRPRASAAATTGGRKRPGAPIRRHGENGDPLLRRSRSSHTMQEQDPNKNCSERYGLPAAVGRQTRVGVRDREEREHATSRDPSKGCSGARLSKTVDHSDAPTYGCGPSHRRDRSAGRPVPVEKLTCNNNNGATCRNDYSCVDLKSMAKLKKLCHLLRTNVIELKTVYEKRCDLGYAYTESERVGLENGLQSLDDNVLRLFGQLDDISGYRKEIKNVVDVYTQRESEYRRLRSMNNKAKFRNNADFLKSPNALRNEYTEDDDDDDGHFSGWPAAIINCLCHPCINKKRKLRNKFSRRY